jgi:succinate dehydrogenase / fumarate reductase, cytochrome b subunit
MNLLRETLRFYSSSVGKKLLMALTGLFLLSFLSVHLYINLFILKADNGGTYDTYAEFMATYPLVRPIEIGLFLGFFIHVLIGTVLWFTNWRVRPRGYALDNTGKSSNLSSRVTIITGAGIFIFLCYHINAFFIQSRFLGTDKTMFQLVAGAFSNPWIIGLYLLALAFLGYHLKHGFQSAFQTFGLKDQKYRGFIDLVAVIFWLLFPLLFATIPAWFLWVRCGRCL